VENHFLQKKNPHHLENSSEYPHLCSPNQEEEEQEKLKEGLREEQSGAVDCGGEKKVEFFSRENLVV
jgi:hypothetical protein